LRVAAEEGEEEVGVDLFMFGENKWRKGGDEKYDKVLIIIAGKSQ